MKKNESFKGWAWLFCLLLWFALLDLEDPIVVITVKQACLFVLNVFVFKQIPQLKELSNWCHTAVSQPTQLKTDLQHYYRQSNMYSEIFKNTLKFFKPLPSGKMWCYYTGRGQLVWLTHTYAILSCMSRVIFNRKVSFGLEEWSTILSLHLDVFHMYCK